MTEGCEATNPLLTQSLPTPNPLSLSWASLKMRTIALNFARRRFCIDKFRRGRSSEAKAGAIRGGLALGSVVLREWWGREGRKNGNYEKQRG